LALTLTPVAWGQQQESLETRLRAELRSTTQQLRDLQSRQTGLEAARVSAEAQRDSARARAQQLQAQLDAARGTLKTQQRSSQARLTASQERTDQMRGAYDQLLTLAREKEAERLALRKVVQERSESLQTCVARNSELYDAGREILDAYQSLGAGSLFKMRQPLAASARVRFENNAQAMGDRLYDNQVQVVQAPAEEQARPRGVEPEPHQTPASKE
tara:strand:+ start:7079 stop:7726 length:648 start_codon:yes stop_codon:yes gene_type:complete